ncbi:hypothetical protein [Ensifer sp. SL37]|uniref:hypothetical protein n=1 Tax=Ensifer sp. SL37 TaxID=2995137 RepID=UPI0022768FF7|nr:hypothetical protein [Ensifer sp. SL37]MCY1746160.1 hypothetical protein [Ensifer sp. SL37]
MSIAFTGYVPGDGRLFEIGDGKAVDRPDARRQGRTQKQWTECRLKAWWNNETDVVRYWEMKEANAAEKAAKEGRELLRAAKMAMPNSSKRPPVFVHWLSLKQRLIIAEKLRGIGSSLAEWICPPRRTVLGRARTLQGCADRCRQDEAARKAIAALRGRGGMTEQPCG